MKHLSVYYQENKVYLWGFLAVALLMFTNGAMAELPTIKPPSGGDSSDILATSTDWAKTLIKWGIWIVGSIIFLGVAYALFRSYMKWANDEDREGVGGIIMKFGVGIVVIVLTFWLLNQGLNVIETAS